MQLQRWCCCIPVDFCEGLCPLWHGEKRTAVSVRAVSRRAPNPPAALIRYHEVGGRRLEDDYELQDEILGSGMSGSIQLVTSGLALQCDDVERREAGELARKVDGRKHALKTFDKNGLTEGRYRHLKKECEVFLTVDHPNIAQLSDVYEWEDGIALIMEYCSGGELLQRLEAQEVYDEAAAAEATSQMLQAVNYLHAHSIVHRDLKLQNFLYESAEKDALLKLIDFGLCETLEDADMKMKASVGTLEFCSPDVISGKEYTSQCDLWSLGVVATQLALLVHPSPGKEEVQTTDIVLWFKGNGKDIERGLVKWDRLHTVSEHARDFVQKLLVVNPAQRMTAETALQHPWLTKTFADVAEPKLDPSVLVSLQQYSSKSKMQRLLLPHADLELSFLRGQLLAQELAPEEVSEMRELFMKLDSDARGTIRLCDLKDAMRRHSRRAKNQSPTNARWTEHLLSPKMRASHRRRLRQETAPFLVSPPADEAEQIFSVLDANGDEEVYYSDFLAATASVRWQLRREVLRKIFNRFDRDRSGTISMHEVQLVLKESLEDGSVEELLEESKVALDSNGEISFEAFVNLFEKKDVLPPEQLLPPEQNVPHALPREDLLRACAWDETPKSPVSSTRSTKKRYRFRRSESEP
ncbi:CPK2 [Symbiodinium sp. KB8]|nr:CPK2 [Symbiodinium sp. KB8]